MLYKDYDIMNHDSSDKDSPSGADVHGDRDTQLLHNYPAKHTHHLDKVWCLTHH